MEHRPGRLQTGRGSWSNVAMTRALLVIAGLAAAGLGIGCRDVPATPDAPIGSDAAIDASTDKARSCATMFGTALTNAFGRVDGTVRAVVPPAHPSCPMPNGTHLVLQVTVDGQVYRMVVNTDVLLAEVDAPLAGPAWAEGWHPGAQLDYVTTLHVASTAFAPHPPGDITTLVTAPIELGARISVFGTSSGGANAASAHLVHRNLTNADGAIVIGPDTSAPHYLLFRFANQTF